MQILAAQPAAVGFKRLGSLEHGSGVVTTNENFQPQAVLVDSKASVGLHHMEASFGYHSRQAVPVQPELIANFEPAI